MITDPTDRAIEFKGDATGAIEFRLTHPADCQSSWIGRFDPPHDWKHGDLPVKLTDLQRIRICQLGRTVEQFRTTYWRIKSSLRDKVRSDGWYENMNELFGLSTELCEFRVRFPELNWFVSWVGWQIASAAKPVECLQRILNPGRRGRRAKPRENRKVRAALGWSADPDLRGKRLTPGEVINEAAAITGKSRKRVGNMIYESQLSDKTE